VAVPHHWSLNSFSCSGVQTFNTAKTKATIRHKPELVPPHKLKIAPRLVTYDVTGIQKMLAHLSPLSVSPNPTWSFLPLPWKLTLTLSDEVQTSYNYFSVWIVSIVSAREPPDIPSLLMLGSKFWFHSWCLSPQNHVDFCVRFFTFC
jgi:hypothetical protein